MKMRKLFAVTFLFLSSASTFADWSGDILCVKPTQYPIRHKIVADAKGRIDVKIVAGVPTVGLRFSSLRIFSEYGYNRGSEFKNLILHGEADDGNDTWNSILRPITPNNVISYIQLDLSSRERKLSVIKTAKENSYEMDCVVRED